jgi:predicted SnoaL-like aldol condensation-catalyzing enzyme
MVAIAAVSSILLAVVVSTSHAQGPPGPGRPQIDQEQQRQEIAVVMGFWREKEGRDGNAASKYIADAYIEHSIGATNGRADLVRRLGLAPPPGMPAQSVVSQTVYTRSPFVLLLQERAGPDPTQAGKTRKFNTIEMFKVYDGLIQEHWMLFPEGQMPATQPQTEQEGKNIAMVKDFWREIVEGRDGNAAPKYIAWGYIENGNGAENATNGRAEMVQRFGRPLPPGRPPIKLVSQTVYASGPFVLLLQDRVGPVPGQPEKSRNVNLIEMFQLWDGLLQQHWIVLPQ